MTQIFRKIRIISFKRLSYAILMLGITCYIFYSVPFFDFVWPVKISDPTNIIELYQNEISCVELTADTLHYSGYDYVENGRIKGAYYYTLQNGTCFYFLLTNSQCSGRPDTLTDITVRARLQSGGKLLSELITKMSSDLKWTPQGLSSVSSRIIVNSVDYMLLKNMLFLSIIMTIFVISLLVLLNVLSYIIYPILHPACSHLRRFGSVKEQLAQIEHELCLEPVLKTGIFTITEHYLIASSTLQLCILPLDKIVWAYKHSSFHHFRFKKTRITYTLRVFAKKKLSLIASMQPKEDVDTVILCIAECNPDVLIHYSKENENLARLHRQS